MQITDPIADLLTRIRNASSSKHETVDVPASNMKKAIVEILNDEGYIKDFQVIEDGKQGVIRITLKYGPNKERVISGLKRVSKPGLRFYASVDELPRVSKKAPRWRRSTCLHLAININNKITENLWKHTAVCKTEQI